MFVRRSLGQSFQRYAASARAASSPQHAAILEKAEAAAAGGATPAPATPVQGLQASSPAHAKLLAKLAGESPPLATATPASTTAPRAPSIRTDAPALNPRELLQVPVEERAKRTKMLIMDMAGTTVQEGGLVYATLQKVMNDAGFGVSDEEMIPWHGAQKTEVVGHFVLDRLGGKAALPPPQALPHSDSAPLAGDGSAEDGSYYSFRPWSKHYQRGSAPVDMPKMAQYMMVQLDRVFEEEIQQAYFATDGPVKLIHPKLLDFFANMRADGCKIALNTGYPTKIQQGLIDALGLRSHIDCAVCAGDVGLGRPYPYMVQLAMRKLEIMDAATVAKAGDTSRDIEEGLHAGAGLAIGVLTGAGSREGLLKAGADIVLDDITQFWDLRTK